ncbi:cytidine deaminase [Asinibacterium sp. OR53]|jgi:cytidine deaminase|uniref:cytidine deaminase n=1 Tax=Asinibacterium sp. OR53 TaxID=925409 RepID=UPI000479211B|nr:cytidine deaminase [Asinibacterium sp. OR53]
MKHVHIGFEYEVYDTIDQLLLQDAQLLNKARETTTIAYAPYSDFKVGAVALLANGKEIKGSNQENASYPVGICAERVLLSAASSLYPGVPVTTLAISYHNQHGASDHPVSPCGLCRQSLLEHETHFKTPIRIIISGMEGKVFIIPEAKLLLPLSFTSNDMNL